MLHGAAAEIDGLNISVDLIEIFKHTDFFNSLRFVLTNFYGFSRIFFVIRHTGNLLRSYARMGKICTDFVVKNSVKVCPNQ